MFFLKTNRSVGALPPKNCKYFFRCCTASCNIIIFNRPGVAGAVLQSPLSLIHWLRSFSSKSSKHHKSKTIRASDLKFCHNVHLLTQCSPHVMCHASCVTCHMSPLMCHLSHVTCHVAPVTCDMYFFFGGGGQLV